MFVFGADHITPNSEGKGRDKTRPQTETSGVLINCSKSLQIRETSQQIDAGEPLSCQINLVGLWFLCPVVSRAAWWERKKHLSVHHKAEQSGHCFVFFFTLASSKVTDWASLKAGRKTDLDILLKVETSCQERRENKWLLAEQEKHVAQLCWRCVWTVCVCVLCVLAPPANSMFWSTSVKSRNTNKNSDLIDLNSLLCNTGMLERDHLTKPERYKVRRRGRNLKYASVCPLRYTAGKPFFLSLVISKFLLCLFWRKSPHFPFVWTYVTVFKSMC